MRLLKFRLSYVLGRLLVFPEKKNRKIKVSTTKQPDFCSCTFSLTYSARMSNLRGKVTEGGWEEIYQNTFINCNPWLSF